MLPQSVINWLNVNAFKYPNIIGFSGDLSIPQMNKTFNDMYDSCIRFYVTNKLELDMLRVKDIIPPTLRLGSIGKKETYDTDVVEIGKVEAIPPIPLDTITSEVDKTKAFRPIELGTSIGNEVITAGSLGQLYNDMYGNIFGGSNAHVLTPEATWTVKEVEDSGKVNILQPGAYHDNNPDNIVGTYLWHKQVYGLGLDSECPVTKGVQGAINNVYRLFHRQSIFKATADIINTVDFGLYNLEEKHILKVADDSIDTSKQFGGHLYAGSELSGVICHISEILKACPYNIKPLNNNYADFKVGDRVKGCSFWCNYETDVIDVNGVLNVGYGNIVAPFSKCVIVTNDGTVKGGWSGSGWYKE